MKKASYEKFQEVFQIFARLKAAYNFTVRINYTFNKDNFYELKDFFNHFSGKSFDILQIRPIQKIGNTEYNDFDLESIREDYPSLIQQIKQQCQRHGITLLAPNKLPEANTTNDSSLIFNYTFCYISPKTFWKPDFNWRDESFNNYSKKIGWSRQLFANIFKSKRELKSLSNRLNYEIELN
jgi:hypothetical protein